MTRRVLIVGYWFVDVNMGGVRLRRISRLLPRQGWEPVVLTHPSDAASVALPEAVRRVEVAAPDLTRLYTRLRGAGRPTATPSSSGRCEPTAKPMGLTSILNRWLMIPDKQVTWYRAAVRQGRQLLQSEKFDAIFASLDPRTCLLAAARLSRESGIPCILEYRDLWTGNPYHHVTQPTALHRWLHERLERKALRQARRVSAVCRGIADYLSQRHAAVLQAPVELNYNFFDPEEYPVSGTGRNGRSAEIHLGASDNSGAVAPNWNSALRPFIVSYTGAMYANRSPQHFFEGLRVFVDQAKLAPGQLRFRWAGSISGITDVGQVLDRTGVRPYVDFLGQIPHREALRELVQSDVALLIQAPHDAIHIPGKLFEALGARVPLLALAHPCEVTEIIARCRAGIVCPHSAESVAAALAQFHRLHTQRAPWEFQEAEVQRFSADAAVARLAALFDTASQS